MEFTKQYINEIYNKSNNDNIINVIIESTITQIITCDFQPTTFGIIIDNIISNSTKAGSPSLFIKFTCDNNYITISFSDNGNGIDTDIKNVESLFTAGTSTTTGIGMGLYEIRKFAKDMNATVSINDNYTNGFELIMKVKR